MIAYLRGIVISVTDKAVVLDVAGVGYLVHTSPNFLRSLVVGAEAQLHIEMVVREDSMTLYGFDSVIEKQLFDLLVSVQGVGAKVALAIQAVLSPDALYTAVGASDSGAFAMASGVGPKLAVRIATELKDKVAKTIFIHTAESLNGESLNGDGTTVGAFDDDNGDGDGNASGNDGGDGSAIGDGAVGVQGNVGNGGDKDGGAGDSKVSASKKTASKKSASKKSGAGKASAKKPQSIPVNVQNDAISAMVNLGYTRSQAFTCVSLAVTELSGDASLQDIITYALKNI